MLARTKNRRGGASLVELLVVLLIMGLMMGLLFPAIQHARARANIVVCENNVYQLQSALGQFIQAKRRFPLPARWSVDLLPWIEQRPLAYAFETNKDPKAVFPRPELFQCPFQDDFESRLAGAGVSHYMLVVDREAMLRGDDERAGWTIHDRPLLKDDGTEAPWFAGPEVTPLLRDQMIAELPGPHPGGAYGR